MFQNNPAIYYLTYRLGFQPALTQTTENEQACLKKYAAGKRLLVEIGVWHGVNTRVFRNVMDPAGKLYAVDPFPVGRFGVSWEKLIAVREAGRSRRGEIHFIEMFSQDASSEFDRIEDNPIDFLFIDGDHSYEAVKTDWLLWSSKIAPGGTVALHDSRSHDGQMIDHLGPARFTREGVLTDTRFELVDTCDSLTVVKRTRT